MLRFTDGRPFATSVAHYDYSDRYSESNRFIVQLEVEGLKTEAVVDTGAPFTVCIPRIAVSVALNPNDARHHELILIRGVWCEGSVHRVGITLLSEQGSNLPLDVSAFFIHANPSIDFSSWPPVFLGTLNCLDAIRFAFDPQAETFYFGPLSHDD